MAGVTVQVEHTTKHYGTVQALRDVSLQVETGELFGLIGPDGAGKTTLFRLIATLIAPDEGRLLVDGMSTAADARAIRCLTGYMPGRFSLYPDLTVEENIAFYAALFGNQAEIEGTLIEPIYKQIAPFATRRAGKLSGGMKQKLALCCALIHKPRLLLLDEPTTGVDTVSRSEFWDMLQLLHHEGITIIVSTPYMDEASRCGRIALMHEGRVLDIDTPAHLVARDGGHLYALRGEEGFKLLAACRRQPGVVSCYAFGDAHHLRLAPEVRPEDFRQQLAQEGFPHVTLTPITPSIEDVFIDKITE